MGLASALSTALTGLTAAETTIDVVGNNLANSNTVGFKASNANFATQFLQTRSLGASPVTGGSGGTNPRQIGLGTMVADITPDFNQGTIEISANPMDLAVQGEGLFIVQSNAGEEFYTRNGIFKLNANNQIVSITGNRLLGYGINDDFVIQETELTPLTVPLGAEHVASTTENVYIQGQLSPTGVISDAAEIIQSAVLADGQYSVPPTTVTGVAAAQPVVASGAAAATIGGATLPPNLPDNYLYKVAFADVAYSPLTSSANEGTLSDVIGGGAIAVALPDNAVSLTALPDPAAAGYDYLRIYRSTDGGTTYDYIAERPQIGAAINFDDTGLAAGATTYNNNTLADFSYSYYVTFYDPSTGNESRPSELLQGIAAGTAGRIRLDNLPTEAAGNPSNWSQRRIYRNLSTNDSEFHRIAEISDIDTTTDYTDTFSDADISGEPLINLEGPSIGSGTLLTNLTRRDGSAYESVFQQGTLSFKGTKGTRTLAEKEMEITATTNVLDLINFVDQAMGLQTPPGPDLNNPIPDGDPDPAVTMNAGGKVDSTTSTIQFIGNNGVDNAIDIGAGAFKLEVGGVPVSVNLPFTSTQSATGESAVADFIAYDSLGNPLRVRLTTALESRTANSTTYRWYADSPDNVPASGVDISVGTGLITFDAVGNFDSATESTVSIDRYQVASESLTFELDFAEISSLATDNSNLAVSRQDGSGAGVLTSFIVGEEGTIRGVFSNGVTRDLGQIRLARFANPSGLEQKGQNMYATGVNSGLPVIDNPGQQGLGTIIGGAAELSNTDIGSNLIDLILASTMYRGNTRVITTAQQLFDELLALRR